MVQCHRCRPDVAFVTGSMKRRATCECDELVDCVRDISRGQWAARENLFSFALTNGLIGVHSSGSQTGIGQ